MNLPLEFDSVRFFDMPLEPLLAKLEQNIADDFSMERLAEAGQLSHSQLYREFYNATGHIFGRTHT